MIEQSESIKHLAVALAKSHLKIKNPTKDKAGMHNSKYATLQACINITREILAENGLSIVQLPIKNEAESGITTMLLHESGEYIRASYTFKLGGSNAQDLGKLISYLRRYSLMAVLNISAEDDDDDADSLITNDKSSFVNFDKKPSKDKPATQAQKELVKKLLGQDEYEAHKDFIQNKMTASQADTRIKQLMGEKKNG